MPLLRPPGRARPAPVPARPALLVLGAVAAALGMLAASAPARQDARHRTPARADDVDRVLRAAGAGGPAHRVWTPNPAHRAGDPGAEPLLPTFEWVAPAGPLQAPHGTVTARQGLRDASLTVTADDDGELGAALTGMAPDEVLVRDGARWAAVAGDRARPLPTRPSR